MTMIKSRTQKKEEPRIQPIHLLLASGGILGTLIGGNVLADREWVSSVVPDHEIDESLLRPVGNVSTEIQAYTPSMITLPDTALLPKPISEATFALHERVVLVDQAQMSNINGFESGNLDHSTQSDTQLPLIPQIAVPIIPERPKVNIQSVKLDLPEIPQVQVPQTVSTSKSSK